MSWSLPFCINSLEEKQPNDLQETSVVSYPESLGCDGSLVFATMITLLFVWSNLATWPDSWSLHLVIVTAWL
jgi:hypothetical protein